METTQRNPDYGSIMPISRKTAPRVDDPSINTALTRIYDDLNELINAVNKGSTSEGQLESSGKSGDLRLAKRSDGTYQIQGRTEEGWISSSSHKVNNVEGPTSYTSHSAGSTTVVSNASTDLNTTTAALKTLRDEVAVLTTRFNESLKSNLSFTTKESE